MPYIPPHIQALRPYQSARDLYQGEYLFLDANENCFGPLVGPENLVNADGSSKVNVGDYPDTDVTRLRRALSEMYGVDQDEIAIFNGSDAAIPEILLAFSDHGGKVAGLDIGFGMYRSFCQIHEREYVSIPTNDRFLIECEEGTSAPSNEVAEILKDAQVCFLDVPNNPSGASQALECIEWMIDQMQHGIFVLDLAYFGFMDDEEIKDMIARVSQYENVLVMYSFSKTWSFAGGRLGAVFGNKKLIDTLIKVRIPYHVSVIAEELGIAALARHDEMERRCALMKQYRTELAEGLMAISDPGRPGQSILQVYPSGTNFLLVKFPENSREIFDRLVDEYKIVLRYFGGGDALAGKDSKLAHCVRITVGLPEQNEKLIAALKNIL